MKRKRKHKLPFVSEEIYVKKTTIPSTSTAGRNSLLHEDNEPTQSVECLSFTDNADNDNVDINETFVTSSGDNETAELLLLLSRMK